VAAEEHSPVMLNQSPIAFFTTAPIIALSEFRHGQIFIISPGFNKLQLLEGFDSLDKPAIYQLK